jgi:hypothetical protein
VALDAVDGGAFKPRMVSLTLIHDIEDGSLPGIERGKFQESGVMDLADINVVVVVEGAGRCWGDERKLKTGFGENESLRT